MYSQARLCSPGLAEVTEHTGEIEGMPVWWRSAPAGEVPALYLHDALSSSDDWLSFLTLGGGIAPDLPGFGRTGKPGYLTYTIDEYVLFLVRFLDMLEVERVRLVAHGWGAVGLAFAQAHPERVQRLVLIDAVPLLPGYEWHRAARIWRQPLVGEFVMGSTTRRILARATRTGGPDGGPLPKELLDSIWSHLDQGTQRATLRLHRSSPAPRLAAAGEGLSRLQLPALVLWGERDAYFEPSWADAYAQVLAAEKVIVPGAGHWPWLGHDEVVTQVVQFVSDQP
jgi:pimeloyl-ACP methyl ester carboxylesterase